MASDCRAVAPAPVDNGVSFQWLHLWRLRKYLDRALLPPFPLPFAWDVHRAVDDWVFLCFFVGNDFLPHLPTLEIRENAIGLLMDLYKVKLVELGGYLTDRGQVNMERTQLLLTEVAKLEDDILKSRKEREKRQRENVQRRLRRTQEMEQRNQLENDPSRNRNAAAQLRQRLSQSADTSPPPPRDEGPEDSVRLGEEGWRTRYYHQKFGMSSPSEAQDIATSYLEGLQWVLRYYYQGCQQWQWFYPYHYAPFAQELADVKPPEEEWKPSTPFQPLAQLMAVLPPRSAPLIPPALRSLLTATDSPLADFYPLDFTIDLNGKRAAWQGVALLPFIDESRLLAELGPRLPNLTDKEKYRNRRGDELLYVHSSSPLTPTIQECYQSQSDDWIQVDHKLSNGLFGKVKRDERNPESILEKEYVSTIEGEPNVPHCETIYSFWQHAEVTTEQTRYGLLPGAQEPEFNLTEADLDSDQRTFRIQNHVAHRMINQLLGTSQQYKSHAQRPHHQEFSYQPYRQRSHDRRDRPQYDRRDQHQPYRRDQYDRRDQHQPHRRDQYDRRDYDRRRSSPERTSSRDYREDPGRDKRARHEYSQPRSYATPPNFPGAYPQQYPPQMFQYPPQPYGYPQQPPFPQQGFPQQYPFPYQQSYQQPQSYQQQPYQQQPYQQPNQQPNQPPNQPSNQPSARDPRRL